MSRGDRREAIFEDDPDRRRFLKTVAKAYPKTGWQVHAYGGAGGTAAAEDLRA